MSYRMRCVGIGLMLLASVAACETSVDNPAGPSAVRPQSLRIDGPGIVAVGAQVHLKALLRYSDGTEVDVTDRVTWSSFDSGAVSLSSDGVLRGVNPGRCGIVARLDAIAAELAVEVVSAPGPGDRSPTFVGLSIAGDTSMFVGETSQLTATAHLSDGTHQTVTGQAVWTSEDPGIATVSSDGLVSGTGPGRTTIATTFEGHSAQAPVTVEEDRGDAAGPTVERLSVSGDTSIQVGETSPLTATAHLSDGTTQVVTTQATWSSADPGIATVSASGVLHGTGSGNTTLVTTYAGIGVQTPVTVASGSGGGEGGGGGGTGGGGTGDGDGDGDGDNGDGGGGSEVDPVLTGLTVSGGLDACTAGVGLRAQLSATAHYSDGSTADVSGDAQWSVGNPLVASISPDGVLTGLLPGVTSAVASYQGFSASEQVRICLDLGILSVGVQGDSSTTLTEFLQNGLQLSAVAQTDDGQILDCTNDAEWTLSGDQGLLQVEDGLVSAPDADLAPILGEEIAATAVCGGESGTLRFTIT